VDVERVEVGVHAERVERDALSAAGPNRRRVAGERAPVDDGHQRHERAELRERRDAAALAAALTSVFVLARPAAAASLSHVAERLTTTAKTVLLPFFFFGFGLTADLSALEWDASTILVFLGLLVLAVLGKIAGPGLCAWLSGMRPRPALVLGVLLNARGLTELIVVQIGYDARIIDARMLAILTLVALSTTIATSPLLRLLKASAPEVAPSPRTWSAVESRAHGAVDPRSPHTR